LVRPLVVQALTLPLRLPSLVAAVVAVPAHPLQFLLPHPAVAEVVAAVAAAALQHQFVHRTAVVAAAARRAA
jgi:hypothetical protein